MGLKILASSAYNKHLELIQLLVGGLRNLTVQFASKTPRPAGPRSFMANCTVEFRKPPTTSSLTMLYHEFAEFSALFASRKFVCVILVQCKFQTLAGKHGSVLTPC